MFKEHKQEREPVSATAGEKDQIPKSIEEGEKLDVEKIIKITEQGINDLENKLGQLLPEKRHEVQWLPRNIQDNIKEIEKIDKAQKFSEHIANLKKRFEDIIERFKIDKKYHQIETE